MMDRLVALWIPVLTVVGTICSGLILLGMVLGPQKDVPAQLDKLLLRVDSVDGRLSKIEWANESQKTQLNMLGNQMAVESSERNKISVALGELKTTVDTIKASYLQREIWVEWKAKYEAEARLSPLTKTR